MNSCDTLLTLFEVGIKRVCDTADESNGCFFFHNHLAMQNTEALVILSVSYKYILVKG